MCSLMTEYLCKNIGIQYQGGRKVLMYHPCKDIFHPAKTIIERLTCDGQLLQ